MSPYDARSPCTQPTDRPTLGYKTTRTPRKHMYILCLKLLNLSSNRNYCFKFKRVCYIVIKLFGETCRTVAKLELDRVKHETCSDFAHQPQLHFQSAIKFRRNLDPSISNNLFFHISICV